MDDGVSVDELRRAIARMHDVPARFVETVEVDERFEGEAPRQFRSATFVALVAA